MPLILEGRKAIVEEYFSSNKLYLGLWGTANDINLKNTNTLSSLAKIELDKNEYSRQEILTTDWTLDATSIVLSGNDFNPITQDWTDIKGFFLSSTEDDSGYLLLTDTYSEATSAAISGTHTVDIDITY